MAYWHGYVLHRWQSPAMPRFTSPLVSPWNIIRGNGLTWDVGAEACTPWYLLDPDRWLPDA